MKTKPCVECGAKIEEDKKFCPFCGSERPFSKTKSWLLIGMTVVVISILGRWAGTPPWFGGK